MSTSSFRMQAAALSARLSGSLPGAPVTFATVAAEIAGRPAVALGENPQQSAEHDADWQRVNSYIADVLKDAHVLYSKLARLQGDFVGDELSQLESISSKVLDLGEELSKFMKAFHEGEASMMKEKQYGAPGGAPPGTPPPSIPAEFKRPEEDFETELDLDSDGEEFEGFEESEESDDDQGQGQQK